jgi:chemotaxis signal transduction protein
LASTVAPTFSRTPEPGHSNSIGEGVGDLPTPQDGGLLNGSVGLEPDNTLLKTEEQKGARSLCFEIAGEEYVSPIKMLREITPLGVYTRIPCTPAYVVGLMNVRGTIVTVIDAESYLHNVGCNRQKGAVLLVDVGSRPVGLLVDRVIDIRLIQSDDDVRRLDLRELVSRVVAISESK